MNCSKTLVSRVIKRAKGYDFKNQSDTLINTDQTLYQG